MLVWQTAIGYLPALINQFTKFKIIMRQCQYYIQRVLKAKDEILSLEINFFWMTNIFSHLLTALEN